MGRQEPSKGLAPPPIRKNQRAKQAKSTLSKTIPALLASDARARRGIEAAELIVDPFSRIRASEKSHDATGKSAGKGWRPAVRSRPRSLQTAAGDERPVAGATTPHASISLRIGDALTAAQEMHHGRCPRSSTRPARNIALLNMASPLRPGGGVRQGATSQEEHLCTRTTLLPSLREEWYRLPAVGGIWSPDVLVFRVGEQDLSRSERFYLDIVTAAMLRFPETREGRYALDAEKELCKRQVAALIEILGKKGVERVVLGAWGCGAYGNPVAEVSRAFKDALVGGAGSALREVLFAITDARMAEAFAEAWGEGIEFIQREAQSSESDEADDGEAEGSHEPKAKIAELEAQIEQTRFPAMKERLLLILAGLKARRAASEDAILSSDAEDEGDN